MNIVYEYITMEIIDKKCIFYVKFFFSILLYFYPIFIIGIAVFLG